MEKLDPKRKERCLRTQTAFTPRKMSTEGQTIAFILHI